MINTNDDFLSDIESDIDGDWKEIQNKIENKLKEEYREKKIKNPPRPCIPNFKEFYYTLNGIKYGNYDEDKLRFILKKMIYNITDYDEENFPESLVNIWEALCNPYQYSHINCKCNKCNKKYDIVYENYKSRISYDEYDEYYGYNGKKSIEYKMMRVYCPLCGCPLYCLNGSVLISIS